jgi:hypothetical protein
MAKDWKQVAMGLKREIRALKALNREHLAKRILAGQEIARLEKRASVLLRGWEKDDAKLHRIRDLIK